MKPTCIKQTKICLYDLQLCGLHNAFRIKIIL
jgi:hypothetical protein